MTGKSGRKPQRRQKLTVELSGSNLTKVSDHNQRVVLQAIRLGGEVSKSEIAAETGLTFPTIANITKRLMDDGLIFESGRSKGPRGSPAVRLSVAPDGCFALGVNIDRDHLTIVILDLLGEIRAKESVDVDFPSPDFVSSSVAEWFDRAIGELGISRTKFVGAGVAMPDDLGRIDIPHKPGSFSTWSAVDVAQLLQPRLGMPIEVDNDAAAAAIGEAQFGNGREHNDFFYILISSGLGGAVIVDNECVRGGSGRAGELGLLPIDVTDPQSRLIQDVVSLSELRLRLERDGRHGTPSQLRRDVELHNPTVRKWAMDAARILVAPLLNVNAILDPSVIYIWSRLPSCLVDSMIQEINRLVRASSPSVPTIAPIFRASYEDEAVAIGAAILAFTTHSLPSHAALMATS